MLLYTIFKMLIIGHRGAKGLAPENTLASLQAALDARVDMIEVDVRVTSDGVPVLHHDAIMQANDSRRFVINKTVFSDLQLAKPDLLTLEAALHFIDQRADVMIEIKPGVDIEPVMACIKPRIERSWLESDFVIASFDFGILQKIRKTYPNVQLMVLDRWSGIRASRRARKLQTYRIVMHQRWLWTGFIKAVSHGGFKLSAYPLNNPRKARRWAKAGLYAAITDYPDRLKN